MANEVVQTVAYLSAEDVARKFGVTRRTINTWRKRLGLPSIRIGRGKRGGRVYFNANEVDLWLTTFNKRRKLA